MYITGHNSDPTSCDDEIDNGTDDDVWNPKDTPQDLKEPVLNTSRSRLNLKNSKLDNGIGDS